MQKVVIFGTLTALFVLLTPPARGQNASDVEKLRRENEQLRKENELLKKENELLKKETELLKKDAKSNPSGTPVVEPDPKSVTRVSGGGIEMELVKCVRHPNQPTRVVFTFSAHRDSLGRSTIHLVKKLILTRNDGSTVEGKVVDGPTDNVWLVDKEPSRFQVSFEGVGGDTAEFAEVGLVMGAQFGVARSPVKFYRIKIEPK